MMDCLPIALKSARAVEMSVEHQLTGSLHRRQWRTHVILPNVNALGLTSKGHI